MDLFISYNFTDEKLVRKIAYHLRKQPLLEIYCYGSEAPWFKEIKDDLSRLEDVPDAMEEENIAIGITAENETWRSEIGSKISACDRFLFFVGARIGDTQKPEALDFVRLHGPGIHERAIVVKFPGAADLPDYLFQLRGLPPSKMVGPITDGDLDVNYAQALTTHLIGADMWVPPDDIPIGYPYDYEKVIIKEYTDGNGKLLALDKIERGCPETWPAVESIGTDLATRSNPIPLEMRGEYRQKRDTIIVDARSRYHCRSGGTETCCLENIGLTFPEAGPRENLVYPLQNQVAAANSLKVGVLVSGGIAPGINAVIKGIVDRHTLYHKHANEAEQDGYGLEITGYRDGFSGLLNGSHIILNRKNVRDFANKGGSLLGTSRYHPLLNLEDPRARDLAVRQIINNLNAFGIDILYVIGGDGSMRAAHMIWTRASQMHANGDSRKISVVAIPKTMDNDILWVWQSFGFMSAVEKAKQFVLQLHTEASSNPRLGIMQLFGSDSGFVVTHAALASGVCDYVLIPEVNFSMDILCNYIKQKLRSRYIPGQAGKSPFGLILMAETAIPQDGRNNPNCAYIHDPEIGLEPSENEAIKKFIQDGRRVQGQTQDALRRGGIKIISRVLQREIRQMEPTEYWKKFRVFTNEPRHLIRAIDPSVQDVIFGQRMGTLAVDNAMAGYTDFMISQWLTEYVLVPLKLVVMGRKRVPQKGIFWKSVIANTGQPQDMI
jgi:6-phosphofructokinase 1